MSYNDKEGEVINDKNGRFIEGLLGKKEIIFMECLVWNVICVLFATDGECWYN